MAHARASGPYHSRPLEARLHWMLYRMLQRAHGRPLGPCAAQLARWERLDRQAFDALRRERVAAALAYARERVPLYRTGEWTEALDGADPRVLQRWPVLDKAVVQTRMDELLAVPRPRGVVVRTTSGSTGRPLRILADARATAWARASDSWPLTWHGLPPGSRTLCLGSQTEPRAIFWVRNQRIFPVTDLSARGLTAAVATLRRWRPALLLGFPSALTEFARVAREALPAAPLPLVPVVKVFGEMLFAHQRAELERLLGARVLETYGTAETSIIAHECPAGALHVLAPHVELEILRSDGSAADPGETGDIVLTSVSNRAMPLVRYRVGDRGRLAAAPCACGRPHPILASVEGRTSEVLVASDGTTRVHSTAVGFALRQVLVEFPGTIAQARFEQETLRAWTVLVRPGRNYGEMVGARLTEQVRRLFGERCTVTVRCVDAIPRDPSGKLRMCRPAVLPSGALPGGMLPGAVSPGTGAISSEISPVPTATRSRG